MLKCSATTSMFIFRLSSHTSICQVQFLLRAVLAPRKHLAMSEVIFEWYNWEENAIGLTEARDITNNFMMPKRVLKSRMTWFQKGKRK